MRKREPATTRNRVASPTEPKSDASNGKTAGRRRRGSKRRDGERPVWDQQLADNLIGKLVLIGLTEVGPDDTVARQTQCFGRVTSARSDHSIVLVLEGQRSGDTYSLPPDLRSFNPAEPGEYKLRSTGEVVVDPDFLCTWTVRKRSQS
jgi:hypothetical protein